MSPFNLADYQPVEERIAEFWQDNPAGRIHTHLVKHDAGEYIVHAMVFRDFQSKDPDATGYAQERETAKGVNSTSALENCETSAIGRALANLGYAAKGKRPSREEMSKVSGGAVHGEGAAPPESTSAPRLGSDVPGNSQHGVGTGSARPVGADESSTGPAAAEDARGATPGDEGLVRQEATDPSSSGPVESANHLHGPYSTTRPDGDPMRLGWVRCEGCDMAFRQRAVTV